MILNNKNVSKYPFIPASSLLVRPGFYLGADVIISACLYPKFTGAYLYISEISPTDGGKKSTMYISDTTGTVCCEVFFDLAQNNAKTIVGIAYQRGVYCGCIYAKKELSAILRVATVLSPDAFIFTPSVVYPATVGPTDTGRLIFPDGGDYTNININVEKITPITPIAPESYGIETLIINGMTISNQAHVCINTDVKSGDSWFSGVRVETGRDSTIKIGRLSDIK